MNSYYDSLSDKKLTKVHNQLRPLEQQVTDRMNYEGFERSSRHANDYPLDWSFSKRDDPFTSNVGLTFNDDVASSGALRFSVYALKVMKEKKTTYSAERIVAELTLDGLLSSSLQYFEEAVELCNSWESSDLQHAGK